VGRDYISGNDSGLIESLAQLTPEEEGLYWRLTRLIREHGPITSSTAKELSYNQPSSEMSQNKFKKLNRQNIKNSLVLKVLENFFVNKGGIWHSKSNYGPATKLNKKSKTKQVAGKKGGMKSAKNRKNASQNCYQKSEKLSDLTRVFSPSKALPEEREQVIENVSSKITDNSHKKVSEFSTGFEQPQSHSGTGGTTDSETVKQKPSKKTHVKHKKSLDQNAEKNNTSDNLRDLESKRKKSVKQKNGKKNEIESGLLDISYNIFTNTSYKFINLLVASFGIDVSEKNNHYSVFDALSEIMRYHVLSLTPKRKIHFEQWSRSFRLMITRDKRDVKEMVEVLQWVYADDFWSKNIASARKFREKYDDLELRSRGKRHSISVSNSKPWEKLCSAQKIRHIPDGKLFSGQHFTHRRGFLVHGETQWESHFSSFEVVDP
jgi:hypothetical protein